MKVLVLNSGSSSLKYRLYDMAGPTVLATGTVERIGEAAARLTHRWEAGGAEPASERREMPVPDHGGALAAAVEALRCCGVLADPGELYAIGHRVVHGGEAFRAPALVDDTVIARIQALVPLAPLHNPPNLLGIEVARRLAPGVPQVAVFDTAFHQSLPPQAYRYALPAGAYERHGVRRYGFHGTSHAYVARKAAEHLGRPASGVNLITLHLGNGASATAVEGGRSVDTSMGLTPLEGLVMGTRCGDLDPAVPFFLAEQDGLDPAAMAQRLNAESGLKGLAGTNDMREVHRLARGGDPRAELALQVFCYRAKKYIGAYAAVLGRLDAVVFTGGIGENDAEVRARICAGLGLLGIHVDPTRNAAPRGGTRDVGAPEAVARVLVVPTDEELEIATQTLACIRGDANPAEA